MHREWLDSVGFLIVKCDVTPKLHDLPVYNDNIIQVGHLPLISIVILDCG